MTEFIWVQGHAGMGNAIPCPYPLCPMGTRFSYLYTHGFSLVPNPCPNRVFTRRVCGYRVPIAIPKLVRSIDVNVEESFSKNVQSLIFNTFNMIFVPALQGAIQANSTTRISFSSLISSTLSLHRKTVVSLCSTFCYLRTYLKD